jgi:hypothetical protein
MSSSVFSCYQQEGTDGIESNSEYDSFADAVTPACAGIKRTPSRASILSTYSSRKRRRVSVASLDLGRDLAVPLTLETPIEETKVRASLANRTCHK